MSNPDRPSDLLVHFGLGAFAGVGFLLSGMLLPQKTFRFFNLQNLLSDGWDPALLLTFVAALGSNAALFWATKQIVKKPVLAENFCQASNTKIDSDLVVGSLLFGLGWGIGGVCPGPSVAQLGVGNIVPAASIFSGFSAGLWYQGKLALSDLSPTSKHSPLKWLGALGAVFGFFKMVGRITPTHATLPFSYFETPGWTLLGGSFIGISVFLYWLFQGKIFGFSGLFRGILNQRDSDSTGKTNRLSVLLGVATAALLFAQYVVIVPEPILRPTWLTALGSFIVGVGTTIANGCTSGHGIAGMSRLSTRSIVATMSFMASAILTVTLTAKLAPNWVW